jgi:soluble lytic murein transglycosylase-like protein
MPVPKRLLVLSIHTHPRKYERKNIPIFISIKNAIDGQYASLLRRGKNSIWVYTLLLKKHGLLTLLSRKEMSMLGLILSIILNVYPPIETDRVEIFLTAYIASVQYQIPPHYLTRLIERESNWDHTMVSSNSNGTKDYGLMQLNDKYYDEFKWRYNHGKDFDPLNIRDSIRIGCKHLSTMFKHTGTWEKAFSAYNAGLSRVRRNDIPTSTKKYVKYITGVTL